MCLRRLDTYQEVGGAWVYLRKWAYTTVISERGLRRRVLLPVHMVEHTGWGVHIDQHHLMGSHGLK